MEKRKRWGARPAPFHFMGQGEKAARARTCTAVLVLLQVVPPKWAAAATPGIAGGLGAG